MAIKLGTSDKTLRALLDEITKPADEVELKAQIEQIQALAHDHPHSIMLVKENIPGSTIYTCFGHSFGLVGVHVNSAVRRYPNRGFVQSLVDAYLQEIGHEQAEEGDHVLYFGQQLQHAGKITGNAIESKWGQGHLWTHAPYELPQKYGESMRFFRRISPDEAIAAFRAFYPYGDLVTP